MDPDFDREYAVSDTPSRSGKIIVSGGAFLMSAAAWAYVGFEEFSGGSQRLGILYATLILLHAVIAILLLLRVRAAWFPGLVLAVTAMGIAIFGQQFPLSGFDALSGVLLFLSRTDFFSSSPGDKR